MRVNTAKSIALGKRIHNEFGSWAKAREAAEFQDGVYVLRPGRDDARKSERKLPRKP
jgi:hypothetical protein